MSARPVFLKLLLATRRCAPTRRQCLGACLLVSYVVGTVGLPAPLAGPGGSCQHGAGGSGACCCTVSSILAGTCCCSKPVAPQTCCSDKSARPSVKAVVRESVQSATTAACCSKSTTSIATTVQTEQDSELRVSGCPCGPGAPAASFICADPRLAIEPVTVVGSLQFATGPALQSFIAPRNVLEPLTPPPRALA